jgi:hypothetical protein
MGRGPSVRPLAGRSLMTTKDPGLAWLYQEEVTAYREYEHAADIEKLSGYKIDDTMTRKYWQGYHDAVINAMAALYGPTPLEEEN